MADIPTVLWDETSPADSQARSLGDDRLRELKTQIREVIAVDHKYNSSGQGTDWGWHNKITLKTQVSTPTAVVDCIILYAKDVSAKAELHFIDEDSNSMQLTSGGDWIGGMADEIRMWSGTLANIPAGWALCDGNSGRPNLIAKFVRGTEQGATGGLNTLTLTESNLPSHTHTYNHTDSSGSHVHNRGMLINPWHSVAYVGTAQGYAFLDYYNPSINTGLAGLHAHTVTFSTSFTGSGVDNRPAYYELAYIVRT